MSCNLMIEEKGQGHSGLNRSLVELLTLCNELSVPENKQLV